MKTVAFLSASASVVAARSCCGSQLCQVTGQACSKSECLSGPFAGSWSCGSFQEAGADDCLFLATAHCTASQLPGSRCVDADGDEGYCEKKPSPEQGPSWPWDDRELVCARRLEAEGRCEGASKVSGAIQPGARRNHIAEMKRRRAREQEALIERLVDHLQQRDKPHDEDAKTVATDRKQ
eukprot:TRINITY_DN6136_c0_g1_i2.p1 TRINITY_DN6136_c0_g1~~TRINITY_DN6136_c0_g1_i2.p1  ORF type:complete len:180 (+),score=25.35 TRINITY_DN6136_c0_g1_i2:158-697(+)